jgi:hypothetical protein
MDNEKLIRFANILVDSFFSEKIVPKDLIDTLGNLVSDNNREYVNKIVSLWEKKNQQKVQEGKNRLDITFPLILTRGYDSILAEDELSRYLPEEKILINKNIFRKKLGNIDFSALDINKEKALIEELRNESIGLSKDDSILYYNLLKINSLSTKAKSHAGTGVVFDANLDYPETIMKLIEEEFGLTPQVLAKLNGGKNISRAGIISILADSIKRNKINPKVFCVLFGYKIKKFVARMKEFIEFTVGQRDESPEEVLQHYGLYLLINGANSALLEKLELSPHLHSFVTDKIGRIRSIYYVSMIFIFTFFYVLVTQVYEISGKYNQSSEDQKAKLLKLYNSEERINMLINNANTLAGKKLADYKVESREVLANLKKFLSLNKDLVTPADLFKTNYGI